MTQYGSAERTSVGHWPRWLVVHERLSGGAFAPLRNAPFALFVVGILGYGAAFAWYMLDRFDLLNLLRDGNYDDPFYYYQIAYHMAEGRFSTFDGGLTRTNGYHPLWLFLLTPFYWLFDKTEALFVFKALEIVLLTAGVALVAVAARVARLPWILLFAVLPALYAERAMLVGFEAALVLFMLGLLLLAMCLFARDPARWRWPLAAVAFALPWARLECAAVSVAAMAALGFLEWSGQLSCARDGSSPGAGRAGRALPLAGALFRLLRLHAAVPLAGAFAGVLVYFAYNGIVFGGIAPVSGAVKALWAQGGWEQEGGYGLAESFAAFARLEAFDGELLTALEVCVYALLVWWLARGSRSREDALLLAFAAGVLGLAAGHLAKFAHSVLSMHPELLLLFKWHFVPAYLMEALVVPLRCCVGIYLVRRFVAPKLPRTADVLRLAAIAAALAVLAPKVDFAAPFRAVDAARDDLKKNQNVHAYMGAAVMDRLLPEDTLVGSWDAGATGYFSRLAVMNLDGLANSYDYKEAIEEDGVGVYARTGARLAFWRRHGLFHFANVYSGGAPGPDMHYLFKAAQGPRPRGALQFKLYRDGPEWALPQADGASWFRKRMTPHLEPQADGIGLLVVGRTAQAFAWDCTADANEVAEWTFGGKFGAVSDWTQTANGVCSSHTLLPHGHLDPVRVRRAPLAEAVAALVGGRSPAIRADSAQQRGFDVYVAEDALVYVKAVCEQVDAETSFFLHLVPAGDDLDDGREAHGFNNLDFRLKDHGDWFGENGEGPCLAEVQLPDYGIARISTGQYMEDLRTTWAGEIHGASWFWERMAPHLDPQGDGVGLLVRGQTAQAFAWNCTGDENDMAEWTFGGRVGAVSDWTQRRAGVCSSDILLPHGHLEPVRVRRAPLAEAVAALVGGRPPAIRADSAHQRGFDVYVAEDALVYVKAACERADAETPFFLHLVPVGDDLDDGREAHGFNNLDFRLKYHGEWFGEERGVGPCLAWVPLPDYGIARITTGQYSQDLRIWGGEIHGASWFWERMAPDLEPQGDGVGLLVGGQTAHAFRRNCTADANDVAEWTFGGRVGAISDWTQRRAGMCSSDILLPHGHPDPVRVRRASLAEAVAALVGGRPPAIRADSAQQRGFDVYVAEDALVYVKAACERADAETPFFLHLVPAGDDFDDGREAHGFNNLDFRLKDHGEWLGEERGVGPCLAWVPLPDYGIARITTGQYMQDLRIVWGGEIRPPTTEGA